MSCYNSEGVRLLSKMGGLPVAVFLVVSFSVVLLGIVVGPIPTHPSDIDATVTILFGAETSIVNTYDIHNTNVTALSLETNTTYIPFATASTTFTLADGTYDNQKKTLVVSAPADIFVDTSWGTMKLESDTQGGDHSVELAWSIVDGVGPRWHVVEASHSAPTWLPGFSDSSDVVSNAFDAYYAYPNFDGSYMAWCDFTATVPDTDRVTVSRYDADTGQWDSGTKAVFAGGGVGTCESTSITTSRPQAAVVINDAATLLVAFVDVDILGVATREVGGTAWTAVQTITASLPVITDMHLSRDGTTLVFGTPSETFEVYKWNGTMMNLAFTGSHPAGEVDSTSVTYDGQTLVISNEPSFDDTEDGETQVWEDDGTGTYSVTFNVTIPQDNPTSRSTVDISGDGLVFVLGDSDGGGDGEGQFHIYRRTQRSLNDWTLIQTVVCPVCITDDLHFGEVITDFTGDVIMAMKADSTDHSLTQYIYVHDKSSDRWIAVDDFYTEVGTGFDETNVLSGDGRTFVTGGSTVFPAVVYR